jgi:uncharacterized delta-60 repeat protein
LPTHVATLSLLNFMKSPLVFLLSCLVLLTARAQTPLKPLISFATNGVTVSESAGTAQIEIRRTRVLEPAVRVQFATTGRPKHCLATTNVVEFAPGETNRFVTVTLVNDEVVNTEEVVILTLTRIGTDSVLGESSMALVIQDDDRIIVGLKKYPAVWDETNGMQVLQAFRTGGLGKTSEVTLAVSLLTSPTATPTTFVPLNQKLTFLPGVTNLEVPVTLRRDYMAKADEQVRIQIGGSTPPNVTVRNVDSQIQFGTLPDLIEGSGTNWLAVRRVGPTNEPASADLNTYDGTAKRGRDFELPITRVEFAAGERERTVSLVLLDNLEQDGTRSFTMLLANPTGARSVDSPRQLTILDDEAVSSSSLVLEDFAAGGFDSSVASLVALPDGRLLVAGSFSKYRGADAKAVAILLSDGALDSTFTVGEGPASGAISAFPVSEGKFLVLGNFTTFAGVPRSRVVRLLADGTVDPDYRLDLNSTIYSTARMTDGGLWIGGFFSTVNNQPLSRLLRLLPDGTLDPAWTGWTNVLGIPSTLLALPAGQLLHDARARFADGTERTFVRLNAGGSPDPGFAPGNVSGGPGSLGLLPDGSYGSGVARWLETGITDLAYQRLGQSSIVLGTTLDGSLLVATGSELRRLRADGSSEPGDYASFDGGVSSVAVLPDGSVVVGGSFTTANGQSRQRIAKIRFAEPPATAVRWHGSRFGGEEDRGPIRVPVVRRGNLDSVTTVSFATRPVDATAGKDYESASGTVTFTPGERVKLVGLTPLPDEEFEADETFEVVLTGDAVDSTGTIATVVLQSDESKVRFATDQTVAVEGGTVRYLTVEREGGLAYPARVNLERAGTATRQIGGISAGVDYWDFGGAQFEFPPGQSSYSFFVDFTSHDDVLFEGTETVIYRLHVPPGAAHPLGIEPDFAEHTVRLHDNDRADGPGEIMDIAASAFPRAGGGVWLQSGLQRPPEFVPGPVALQDDGSPDPTFVADPVSLGILLRSLDDNRTVVKRYEGSSDNLTSRISRLAPGGEPDPTFTPMTFPDPQTAANDYKLQNYFAVADDGGFAAVTWEPGSQPTAKATRGIVVRRYGPAGGPAASWTNRDLMGSGYFSPVGITMVLPLPTATFLDSGAALVLGRLQFRWQTNSGTFVVQYPVRPLARLTADGLADPDFFVELSEAGRIHQVVALPGDHCLIIGDFYSVNGALRPGLARLLPDGSVDPTFQPELPPGYPKRNELSGLATGPGGHVWLCLKLGEDDYRIRVLDTAGKLVPGFVSPQFNGPMWSIAPLTDGRVVVSGNFDLIGGVPRARYAWLDATGKVLPAAPLTLNLLPPQAPGTPRVRIGMRFTGPVTLETSSDLQSWLPVKTIEGVPGEMDTEVPGFGDGMGGFYRVRR